MNKRTLSKVNNIYEQHRAFVFYGVCFLLLSSIFLYTFFVNSTVLNIVKREKIEQEIAVLNTDVSEIESEYMKLGNNINMEVARSLGFVEILNPHYAIRNSNTKNQAINVILGN